MKKPITLTLTALLLISFLTGCMNRYTMRLTNGAEITTRSKPKLDEKKKVYRYKNANGDAALIPAIRVSEIEPL